MGAGGSSPVEKTPSDLTIIFHHYAVPIFGTLIAIIIPIATVYLQFRANRAAAAKPRPASSATESTAAEAPPSLSGRQPSSRTLLRKAAMLDELKEKVPMFDEPLTPYQCALELLADLGARLNDQEDDEGTELLSQAIGLLAQSMRRSSDESSRPESPTGMRGMLRHATTREAVGVRAWMNSDVAERGGDAAEEGETTELLPDIKEETGDDNPLLPRRFATVRKSLPLQERVVHPLVDTVHGNEAELHRLLESQMLEWDFDSLRLAELSGGHALIALGWAFFERYELRTTLEISSSTVLEFLTAVESAYLPVLYHNAEHGTCVTHGFLWLIQAPVLQELALTPIEVLSCLIAALCHDVAHDGHNTKFHNTVGTDIALRYSFQSPLERHHLATTWSILSSPRCNLLGGLTLAQKQSVREKVVALVLATDFEHHKSILDQFGEMLAMRQLQQTAAGSLAHLPAGVNAAPGKTATGRDNWSKLLRRMSEVSPRKPLAKAYEPVVTSFVDEEKLLTLKLMLKCADLSNLSKGAAYAHLWTDRIIGEFYAQGDDERERGLPVTDGFDRHINTRNHSQMGFIKFLVLPMYEAMAKLTPLEHQLANLHQMIDYYAAQIGEPLAAA